MIAPSKSTARRLEAQREHAPPAVEDSIPPGLEQSADPAGAAVQDLASDLAEAWARVFAADYRFRELVADWLARDAEVVKAQSKGEGTIFLKANRRDAGDLVAMHAASKLGGAR